MSTATTMVTVQSVEQLEMEVTRYIAKGFVLMNRTDKSVTLFKKKEFSILWLVLGLILCVVPLLIYLIIYAGQKDQMVQILVSGAAPVVAPMSAPPGAARISDDGKWSWDGANWNPVAQAALGVGAPPPETDLPQAPKTAGPAAAAVGLPPAPETGEGPEPATDGPPASDTPQSLG
jgi:hypothetical protein